MYRVLLAALVACLVARSAVGQDFKMNPTYGTLTLRGGENAIPSIVKVEAGGNINTKLGGVMAWVANPPDARLNYTAGKAALVIRVESEVDTTLLVNLPDGKWIANDDGPNTGFNPYIRIDMPMSGQYDIWVGTFNKGVFPPAVLLVSDVSMETMQKASQYAVVEVENRMSKDLARYKIKWGEGPWSNPVSLKPGRHQAHSIPQAGGRAPVPQISFEKGLGSDAGSTVYNLESLPSSSPSGGGKGYFFSVRTGQDTRDYVELLKRTKNQEDAAFKLNTAIMRTLANDFKSAQMLATKAIELDPMCTRAYTIRGRARQFDGDYDGALRDFAQGLKLSPSDADLVVFRTETFARKKRTDRVIEEATKALEMDPNSASALAERGAAYFAMRNYDAAIADCRKAIKLEPRNYFPLTTLGESYIAKGQPILGLDFLNQAIAQQPNDYEPYAARGQAHKVLGDNYKSAADYREAMRLKMPPGYAVHYADEVAFRDLDVYQIGKLISPELLNKFNREQFEIDPQGPSKAPKSIGKDLDELIAGEWTRHRAIKFESVAGVDQFLRAARMTEQDRKAKGLQLDWYYGPMTSPVARFRSGDDLGGLRIIGNLKFPNKQELTMIFALTYFPPGGEDDNGKVGLLFDGDNARLQMRLHDKGSLETDVLFAGFGANVKKGKMAMRAAYNLDETLGTLTHETLTPASLSTRCTHCHNKGFEVSEKLAEQLQLHRKKDEAEIAKIVPLRKFLELVEINGGSRKELGQLEKQMVKQGPESLIPLDDLYQANRQYWLEIYPQYVEMRRDPKRYLENAFVRPPMRPGGAEMKDMPAGPNMPGGPGGKMPANMPGNMMR